MEANEIRVGNIFIGYDDKLFSWGLKEFSFIEPDVNISIDEIIKSPVVISEEILLKIGFGWNIGKSAMWNEHEFLIGKDNEGFYFAQWQYDSNEDPYPSHIVHVNMLHDLQNLHKLITGQELNTSGLTKND